MRYHSSAEVFELTLPEQQQSGHPQYVGYLMAFDTCAGVKKLLLDYDEELRTIGEQYMAGAFYDAPRYNRLYPLALLLKAMQGDMEGALYEADQHLMVGLEQRYRQP